MSEALFSPSWHRVCDLRPRLRTHAQIQRHRYRGETWYVLRDPASQRAHRFAPAAHFVIGLMNGERTVDEVWRLAADELGDGAPTQGELIQLLGQLHAADVLQCDIPPDAAELFERARRQTGQERVSRWLNPLAVRVPLWDPDRFLTRTIRFVRPLFGAAGALLWLAAVLPALVLAGVHWSELTQNLLDHVFAPRNLLVLALIFPLLKSLHELGHGYAAKAFGGEVHDIGVMFLVLAPVPYVDASCSWAFESKYRRALVGAGGMLVEVFIAALAFYVWLAAEPGVVRAVAYNTLVIGGATTLLFNANPLLRFDGYYILSDLIEIPNLRARASAYVAHVAERRLLGNERAEPPHSAPGEPPWLVSFAVASFVYRIFLVWVILLALLDRSLLLGIALGGFAAIGWIGMPSYRAVRYLFTSPNLRRNRPRALALSGGALAVVALLLAVPFPLRTRSEGVVWLPEAAFVRSGAEGFIQRVVATPGSWVEPGDLLFEVRDAVLETEVVVLAARVREFEARYALARERDQVAAKVVEDDLTYARQQLARTRERAGDRAVRSAASGHFVVPRSDDLPGRFVRKGQLLAHVVDPDATIVRVVVSQDTIDLVRQRTRAANVRFAEHLAETHSAVVRRVVPAASENLPSAALGSGGGGEVAIDPTEAGGARAVRSMFEVELELPPETPAVNAGGRAYVRFDHGTEPLAVQWFRRARQLFLSRFEV